MKLVREINYKERNWRRDIGITALTLGILLIAVDICCPATPHLPNPSKSRSLPLSVTGGGTIPSKAASPDATASVYFRLIALKIDLC